MTSSLSAGTNALLRLGATPVTSAEDVLEAYGIEAPKTRAAAIGSIAEKLLSRLEGEPLTADEVVRAAGVEPGAAAAALVELELAGRVTLEDGVYRAAI